MKHLIIRSLTGIAFVCVVAGAIWFSPVAFLVVFALLTGLLVWEFYSLTDGQGKASFKRLAYTLGGVYLFAATFFFANGWAGGQVFLPYLLFLTGAFIGELYFKAADPVRNWSLFLLGQVYCAGFFSLLNFITALPVGNFTDRSYCPFFTLAVFVFIWLNDTGAYLFGVTLGRHRLFERISPKKSWEGFAGGMLITLASSLLFFRFFPEINLWQWAGLATVVVVFGTWGDLVESLLKRTLYVKDSGTLLPGHGGMLDRFDSLLLAIPAAWIYIEWFIQN